MNDHEEEKSWGRLIGNFLGAALASVVLIGLTGVVVLLGWNYALVDVTSADNISYFQCLLLVLMVRATIKLNK